MTHSEAEKVESLVKACFDGDLALVIALLNSGVPIDAMGEHHNPLHAAIENMQEEVVSYLLELGADPNSSCGEAVFSALHHAIDIEIDAATQANDPIPPEATITKLLLEAGADINMKDYRGETPLQMARHRGHQKAVLLLQTWDTV
ncbi:MAG: ankyrin repeat domain-containing protein [Anaerolineae bacterium]|nr:ankyrin repeat domain-containing protein [Gloeobacterales cyanobacterium ES-bin-313]